MSSREALNIQIAIDKTTPEIGIAADEEQREIWIDVDREPKEIGIAVDRSARTIGVNVADRWKEVFIGVERGGPYIQPYEGPYHVIPALYRQQRLRTYNRSMKSDVLVDAIKFTQTENPQGGMTVVIG